MSEPDEPRRIEAVVQAGPCESRYVRTGHGNKVLLLLPQQRTAWLEGPLVRSLAEQYCVVVPELPERAGTTALLDWLVGFLDGTGYVSTIVAEPELAAVLERAASTDERITRVVYIDGSEAPASADEVLARIRALRD